MSERKVHYATDDPDELHAAITKLNKQVATLTAQRDAPKEPWPEIDREETLTCCHASRDGECTWTWCPQRRDYRDHCPLDFIPRAEMLSPGLLTRVRDAARAETWAEAAKICDREAVSSIDWEEARSFEKLSAMLRAEASRLTRTGDQ